MRLIADIERGIGAEPSLFRAQLLREDLARLRRLDALARSAEGREAFARAARTLGWTQGDQRTAELEPQLAPLLDAIYAHAHGATGEADEERIRTAWRELTRARVERLVGCLSTPPPRPDGS